MINIWEVKTNFNAFKTVVYYLETFLVKPWQIPPYNVGIFDEYENLDDKKVNLKKKKPLFRTPYNPEIPKIQIGGVSWEYLKLKHKNIKQDKLEYEEHSQENYGIIKNNRTGSGYKFIVKKKEIPIDYVQTKESLMFINEEKNQENCEILNSEINMEAINNFYRIAKSPDFNWDLYSLDEKVGRKIKRKITI